MRNVPRTIPLAACLVIGAAGLVAAATMTATALAHRWAVDALEASARSTVGFAAAARASRVASIVDARRRSLDALMDDARSKCGYPIEGGGMLWSLSCVTPLVGDFHTAQRTAGMQVIRGVRPVLQLGAAVSANAPASDSPDRPVIVHGPSGAPAYQLRGVERGLVVVAEYGFDEIAASLGERPSGAVGESWLVDGDGRVLAAPAGSSAHGGSAAACTGNDVDGDVADAGGAVALRAMRPVGTLDACVEARLLLAPAVTPAGALRATLQRWSAGFVVFAAVLAFLLARWVTAPARRLTAVASAVGHGEAAEAIVPSGPSELRALGVAMQSLSSDVAQRLRAADAARREAEAASAAKDQFVTMLSQELRTLVTTVSEWVHGVPGASASGR